MPTMANETSIAEIEQSHQKRKKRTDKLNS